MNILKIITSILLLIIAITPSQAKFVQSMSNIIDGDTIDITTLNSYRLAGIDAPEHDQPLGDKAQLRLKEILESAELVSLWCMPKNDKYGRDVCMITLRLDDKKLTQPKNYLKKASPKLSTLAFYHQV